MLLLYISHLSCMSVTARHAVVYPATLHWVSLRCFMSCDIVLLQIMSQHYVGYRTVSHTLS